MMELKKNGAPPLTENAPHLITETDPVNVGKDTYSPPESPPKSSEKINSKESPENPEDTEFTSPFIPDDVFKSLPELLKKGCACFSDKRERDVYLISALVILSGCIDSVTGVYDNQKLWANLFALIVAPPASGKGSMRFARKLAEKLNDTILERSTKKYEEYEALLRKYDISSKKDKMAMGYPVEPEFKMLIVPANTSAAKMTVIMKDANGSCIICESEADTLFIILKQEWGLTSDMLRKVFHHEPISLSRKGKKLNLEIKSPQMSLLLTGTRGQFRRLFSSAENGLFSRFIFYGFRATPSWKDPFSKENGDLDLLFANQSLVVEEMSNYLIANPTEVQLSLDQQKLHNSENTKRLRHVSVFVSEDAVGSVKRLGLIQFRICMILSALRKHEIKSTEALFTCSDDDFMVASYLCDVLLEHTLRAFSTFKTSVTHRNIGIETFHNSLPVGIEFTTTSGELIGTCLKIEGRTVRKYLKLLVENKFLEKPRHGFYLKKFKL